MFSSNGCLDYVNATQEQLLGNIEKHVKELMKAEKPAAETAGAPDIRVSATNKYNFPERSQQEEFEGIMVTFMNNQEKQIQHLEARMEGTRNAFMDLADKFISRIKEKSTPKKIEKIFEAPTPLVCGQEDNEKSFSSALPSNTPYFCKHPQEEKNSQFHNIFVGCLQTTLPNLCKRRSFGFKPGVKGLHLKTTTALGPSMERLLLIPTVDRYDGYNSTETLPTPFDNHISIRDSNEMFDPGGLY